MKIRTDFVTNSSSSSFILASKGELSEAQKAAIISFVEKRMLGEVLSEEDVNKILNDGSYLEDKFKDLIRQKLNEGFQIREGFISFNGDEDMEELHQALWETLEKADPDSFQGIDTDLIY